MQVKISSKGQLVLPAPIRRRWRLKAKSRLEIEEREDGLFLRPVSTTASFHPIDYPPPGTLKVNRRLLELDKLSGPDVGPGET